MASQSTTNLTLTRLGSILGFLGVWIITVSIPAVNHVRAIWHSVQSLFMEAGHAYAAFHLLLQGHTNNERSF